MTTTTILLTTTVNIQPHKSWLFQRDKQSRVDTYMKDILQWLQKTHFPILLVENSGYPFDELSEEKKVYKDRFEVVTFVEEEVEEANYLEGNDSKGASEIFAIDYAYKHSKFIHASHFIIKITGRFFIPELESYLREYNLDEYDCLTQSNRGRCEMVGSHSKHFLDIFAIHLKDAEGNYDPHIENVWRDRTSKYPNILICKSFVIERTQRGGEYDCFESIYTF